MFGFFLQFYFIQLVVHDLHTDVLANETSFCGND